jgi:hypothetical protein
MTLRYRGTRPSHSSSITNSLTPKFTAKRLLKHTQRDNLWLRTKGSERSFKPKGIPTAGSTVATGGDESGKEPGNPSEDGRQPEDSGVGDHNSTVDVLLDRNTSSHPNTKDNTTRYSLSDVVIPNVSNFYNPQFPPADSADNQPGTENDPPHSDNELPVPYRGQPFRKPKRRFLKSPAGPPPEVPRNRSLDSNWRWRPRVAEEEKRDQLPVSWRTPPVSYENYIPPRSPTPPQILSPDGNAVRGV